MLKYRISRNNCNKLLLCGTAKTEGRVKLADARYSYNSTDIRDILLFIHSTYSTRVNTIRDGMANKIITLNTLNKALVAKKKLIQSLIVQEEYNPSMIATLTALFKGWTKEEHLSHKQKYGRLSMALASINHDIKHINTLRSEFKRIGRYYSTLCLSYGREAKITAYDLKKARDGVLTPNAQECLYFYLARLRTKAQSKRTVEEETFYNPLMDSEAIKEVIREHVKKSLGESIRKRIKTESETLYNRLLTKYL